MAAIKRDYEATGGIFIEHSDPKELYPGVCSLDLFRASSPSATGAEADACVPPMADVEDTIRKIRRWCSTTERVWS